MADWFNVRIMSVNEIPGHGDGCLPSQWGNTMKSPWVNAVTSRYPHWYDLDCCQDIKPRKSTKLFNSGGYFFFCKPVSSRGITINPRYMPTSVTPDARNACHHLTLAVVRTETTQIYRSLSVSASSRLPTSVAMLHWSLYRAPVFTKTSGSTCWVAPPRVVQCAVSLR